MKKRTILIFFSLIFLLGCQQNDKSQELERQKLDEQYKEISDIANSITCENAEDWLFTPIGSKACGGPIGYLAYSIHIDTVSFLEKVSNYTNAERAYNEKWGVISDCMMATEPVSISCIDGEAHLNY